MTQNKSFFRYLLGLIYIYIYMSIASSADLYFYLRKFLLNQTNEKVVFFWIWKYKKFENFVFRYNYLPGPHSNNVLSVKIGVYFKCFVHGDESARAGAQMF